MGTLKKTEWTEKKIQDVLKLHFLSASAKKYEITNLFIYDWESDYLALTKSGYVYEIEIKISRNDFKNDFKHKADKHTLLENVSQTGVCKIKCPNYFYYAVPDGLVTPEEVPEYAGLIYAKPWGIEILKESLKFNTEKQTIEDLGLTDKFYYNLCNWKAKYDELFDDKLKKDNALLKKENWNLTKQIMEYDDMLSEAYNKIQDLENEIKRRDIKESKGTLSGE